MRANRVVPKIELVQGFLQHRSSHKLPEAEAFLQRAEEPFDPPILPGTMLVGTLVLDADYAQNTGKKARGKNSLIVRPNGNRLAVLSNRQKQIPQQRPRTFVDDGMQ